MLKLQQSLCIQCDHCSAINHEIHSERWVRHHNLPILRPNHQTTTILPLNHQTEKKKTSVYCVTPVSNVHRPTLAAQVRQWVHLAPRIVDAMDSSLAVSVSLWLRLENSTRQRKSRLSPCFQCPAWLMMVRLTLSQVLLRTASYEAGSSDVVCIIGILEFRDHDFTSNGASLSYLQKLLSSHFLKLYLSTASTTWTV